MDLTQPASRTHGEGQFRPDWAAALVDRYRRFSTRDLADVRARLQGMRDEVILSLDRPEDFVSYDEVLVVMGELVLTVGRVDSRTGYGLSFKSGDEYIVTIPLRGTGWVSTGDLFVEYGREDIMIVAPQCRVEKHWDGPGEVLSIHVPAQHFDDAFAKLTSGAMPAMPIVKIDGRRLRSFLRFVEMICRDLQDSDGPSHFLQAPLSEQTEQMLLTLLLDELRVEAGARTSAAAVESPALPYYVRRAQKYIVANAHLEIGVEQIARIAGVSVRTVQYGFREFFDTTPMLYLKRVRYERARNILLADCTGRKISDVAIEIGCANFSQFSRDYRSLYGETPSRTVAQMRRMVT